LKRSFGKSCPALAKIYSELGSGMNDEEISQEKARREEFKVIPKNNSKKPSCPFSGDLSYQSTCVQHQAAKNIRMWANKAQEEGKLGSKAKIETKERFKNIPVIR
jgi:hypothetical protein